MFQPNSINRSAALPGGAPDFSNLLRTEKERMQSELSCRLESLHSGPIAAEDQAPVSHEQFVSIRHNNFAYEKIKAIDAALARLKRGEYGVCEECGDAISARRLKAVPWARYCLECQENLAAQNGSPAFRQLKAA